MSKARVLRSVQVRWYSVKEKPMLNDSVDTLLTDKEMKHRHHPGIVKPRSVEYPKWLVPTIRSVIKDEAMELKAVCESGTKLSQFLKSRLLPLEQNELRQLTKDIQEHLGIVDVPDQVDCIQGNKENLSRKLLKNPKFKRIYKQQVNHWAPVEYDKLTGYSYMVGRTAQDYAVLYKIFSELQSRDKNFKPQTVFDFGSGIGTALWTISQVWPESLKEYFSVDVSQDMNELSEKLTEAADPPITAPIFRRQFFPVSTSRTYDLVVTAYTLLELPNAKARLDAVLKLWMKTHNYLVIVEQGTNAGFQVVREARGFLLKYMKKCNDSNGIHILAPCPHVLQCPIAQTDEKPCTFPVVYRTMPLSYTSVYKQERFSYIILKKGTFSEDNAHWPRIIRPVLRRSKHVICRMCTDSGELKEEIFTKWKNGTNMYRCARTCEWGDRIPVDFKNCEENPTSEEET